VRGRGSPSGGNDTSPSLDGTRAERVTEHEASMGPRAVANCFAVTLVIPESIGTGTTSALPPLTGACWCVGGAESVELDEDLPAVECLP
jgi:hypothetical protein